MPDTRSTQRRRPTETVRVVLIGAGRMAGEHARAFRIVPGVEIVAVASRSGTSAERLAAVNRIPTAGTDWAELAKREVADACLIATDHHVTAKIAGEAIEAGYHTLIEKPVSLDPSIVRSLAASADAAGVVAMVAMNRRFFRSVLAAIDIVRLHGPLVGITLQAPDPVRPKRAWGGYTDAAFDNWTLANTLHAIDLLRLVGGEIAEVERRSRTVAGEASTVALLRFADGTLGTYGSHGATGGLWRMQIHGQGVEADLTPLEFGTVRIGAVEEPLPNDDAGVKYGTEGQTEAFAAAVRLGRVDRPACDLEDHARSLELARTVAGVDTR